MENRIFIPGSEWVYFKLYTGTKTADAILKNEIYGFVREMLDGDIADKWFFIRYSDPNFHIRLRLHLKDSRDFGSVFNRFYQILCPVVNSGLVWNIQCDTYQREMERYGANTISLAEDLFFMDSEFVVRMLHQLNEENHEQHRWQLSISLIDSFLAAFSFELDQRKKLLGTMAENYKKEFGFTHHNMKKQLDGKYRTVRKEVEQVMSWEKDGFPVSENIKARMNSILPIAGLITAMEKAGELQISIDALLTSMIHMSTNRWFRTKNRLHEMVIYDFMSRYYTSESVKLKNKSECRQ